MNTRQVFNSQYIKLDFTVQKLLLFVMLWLTSPHFVIGQGDLYRSPSTVTTHSIVELLNKNGSVRLDGQVSGNINL